MPRRSAGPVGSPAGPPPHRAGSGKHRGHRAVPVQQSQARPVSPSAFPHLFLDSLPPSPGGGGRAGGAEGGKAWERPAWGPPAGLTLWQPRGAQATGHSWYSPRLPRPCQGHPRRGSPRSLFPHAANPRVAVPPLSQTCPSLLLKMQILTEADCKPPQLSPACSESRANWQTPACRRGSLRYPQSSRERDGVRGCPAGAAQPSPSPLVGKHAAGNAGNPFRFPQNPVHGALSLGPSDTWPSDTWSLQAGL